MLAVGRRGQPPRHLQSGSKVTYWSWDGRSESLGAVLAENLVQTVVLLAFISRPTKSECDAIETCVRATWRALRHATLAGVRRVILVSSTGVYGPGPRGRLITEADPPQPNAFQFSRLKALQELAHTSRLRRLTRSSRSFAHAPWLDGEEAISY